MKPVEEFHRRSELGPEGRASQCKACKKKKSARYYEKNRERIIEQTNAYRREHLEQAREYTRHWRERNPEKAREIMRAYIARDPKAWRERAAAWDRKHPERHKQRVERRRARLLDAFVTDVVFDEILQRDLGHCGICGGPIMGPIHLDHIIPLAAGGTHEPDNVQLAHPHCNHRKSATVNFTLAA